MQAPLLKLTEVTRCFSLGDKAIAVLKRVNLSIAAGEFVAIVGASGSGKSTLMNILGCLDHPSSGSYQVEGNETCHLSRNALARLRREYFGFIFQRYHLMSHLSAVMNVEMPAIYLGRTQAQRRACVADLLARLQLAEYADHRPSQLSGGQQQRVSIARALINGGQVILADEPTGALDSKNGQKTLDILRELNAHGHTVIIVTHDAHIAAQARRIIEISDGEIVADRENLCINEVEVQDVRTICNTLSYAGQGASAVNKVLPHAGALFDARHHVSAATSRFVEAFRIAYIALVAHKLRTLLTMLGIIIGIMSVVSIVAIGEGAKHYMLDELSRIGTNTINIYPGHGWGDSDAAAIQTLTPADVAILAEQSYVDSVTPETSRDLLLRYRNAYANARINGVGASFFRVRGYLIEQGISFGADEIQRQAQVAVIDQNTQQKLFGANSQPLGKVILIDNLPCVVIGVVSSKNNMFYRSNNLNVWVPYTMASGRLFGKHYLDSVILRVRKGQSSQAAERSLTKLMLQRHGRKDFFTDNLDSMVKTLNKTSRSLTLLLSLIALISLIVGGIGVMNIMLVSVTERTREIGIRMAVGARQTDIMQQFLIEAVLVCLIGGVLGILFSFGASFLFSYFVKEWKMIFTSGSIILAFLCSTLIGIVFGFIPARNASRLNLIDALARD